MKPLPGRPPLSTRRSRGEGGGTGVGSSRDLGVAVGGSSNSNSGVNTARRGQEPAVQSSRGVNSTWMKKLEDKYQKLHHKIANIPSCNTAASRFNFLTRKILNERLAKASKNNSTAKSSKSNNDDGDGRGGGESRRCSSTDPITVSYRNSLLTEELISQPPLRRLGADDSDDDLDDENFPPTEGFLTRPVTALNWEGGDLASLSDGSHSHHFPHHQHHSHSAPRTHPSQHNAGGGAIPWHDADACSGGGGGGGSDCGCKGEGGGPSHGAVENLSGSALPASLKRDGEAAELNNNMGTDLAGRTGPLAHHTSLGTNLHGQQANAVSASTTTTRRFASASELLAGTDLNNTTTSSFAAVDGSGVMVTASRDHVVDGGGVVPGGHGWVSEDMGETSARGVRTLHPVTSGRSKHGGMVLTPQTGVSHYSHTTTKSCPAAFSSNELPAQSRRRPYQQHKKDPAARGGPPNMRVFAQMSVEARHAVTETLKEMGAAHEEEGGKDSDEGEEEGEEEYEGEEGKEEVEEDGCDKEDVDDNNNNNNNGSRSNTSLPSITDHPPILSAHQQKRLQQQQQQHLQQQHLQQQQQQQQQQQSHPKARRGKPPRHQSESSTTHQQQHYGSREDVSHKTTTTRQHSWRTNRNTDTTSSVNATVRGGAGRSPRRLHREPSSTTHNSTNMRVRPKSDRTMETTYLDLPTEDVAWRGYEDNLDMLSMASVGSASSNRSSPELRREALTQRMHLPAITSRTEPNALAPMRHVNYRIRGVGSYRVARETTFEITAPDFDIRYRDVITCQRGDRDTPPPEIFEKSVSKVRDWLNKYCTS